MLAQHRRDVDTNLAYVGAVFLDGDDWKGGDETDITLNKMPMEVIGRSHVEEQKHKAKKGKSKEGCKKVAE